MVLGALPQGSGMGWGTLLFVLAARAVLRGEEVAAATEQQGAHLFFHIIRQRVCKAETQTHKSGVIKKLNINC